MLIRNWTIAMYLCVLQPNTPTSKMETYRKQTTLLVILLYRPLDICAKKWWGLVNTRLFWS